MDETIFSAQRPALLNGIEEIVTRGDLLDRSILLDLPPIPEDRRRPAGVFWREFDAARPRLLGALLDAMKTALHRAPQVHLARLPRMADFAIWATAAAPALGWPDDYFMSMYTANREQAHELALDASPVAAVIRALADQNEWSGTAADLLETVTALADETTRRLRSWPTTPRYLGGEVRRLAPNLRSVGVAVEFSREARAARRRIITIKKVKGQDGPYRPHRPEARDGAPLEVDGHRAASSSVDGQPSTVDGSQLPRPSIGNTASTKRLDGMDDVDGTAPGLSNDAEARL